MKILSDFHLRGDIVDLKVSREKHQVGTKSADYLGDDISRTFSELFNKSFGEVNRLEQRSTELTTQMTVDPDSVEIHDVMLAAEQAEMAVLYTKAIVDRVIKAYKEIVNPR